LVSLPVIAEFLFCYCQKILFWGNQVLHHGIAKNWQKQNWTLIFLGGNSVFFWGTVILADDSTERLNNGNQIQRKMHVSFGSIEKNIYA